MASEKITLISADTESFEVTKEVAMQSEAIKSLMADIEDTTSIPLPKVKGWILEKVIQYCSYHHAVQEYNEQDSDANPAASTAGGDDEKKLKSKMAKDDIAAWDRKFIDIDLNTLYFLTLAAHYLNVKELLELCCEKVADTIRGKKPEEIRETFNIKNDFTPEEEEQIRKENAWAFEN